MPNVTDMNTASDGKITFELSNGVVKIVDLAAITNVSPGGALGAVKITTDADDGRIFRTPVDCEVIVHLNSEEGFGCAFTGAGNVVFNSVAGVTVTDKRTDGSVNPVAALVQVDQNSFEVWGAKA
jgi:hypothetical protein